MPLPLLPQGVHLEKVIADLEQRAKGNAPPTTRAAWGWVAAVVAAAIEAEATP